MRLPAAISNKLLCWSFYLFGCYRGTGARLKYIAEDWSEVQLELPLSWRTRNYVGTIFGGSIYAAVDPIYMLMLIRRLGPEFIVWDKAAKIEFLKPGRETLQARFAVDEEELSAIRLASPEGATLGRPHLCSRIEGCLRNSVRSSRKDHLCPAP